jgi:hypothetical protein
LTLIHLYIKVWTIFFTFRIQDFGLINNFLILGYGLASYPSKLILLFYLHNWFLVRFSVCLYFCLKMSFVNISIIVFLLLNIISLSCLQSYLQSHEILNVLQVIKLFLILIVSILLENLLRLAIVYDVYLIFNYKSCPLVFIILFYFSVIDYHISVLSLLKFVLDSFFCVLVLGFDVHYFWRNFFVLKNVLGLLVIILIVIHLLLSNNIALQ